MSLDASCGTPTGSMKAESADEHFATYDAFVDWFDEPTQILVLVGPGKLCLLGTDMLKPQRLEIDYGQRTAQLIRNPAW